MLHLHNNYSFTESLVETVIRSLRHSCRSELTRQGTSLSSVPPGVRRGVGHFCQPLHVAMQLGLYLRLSLRRLAYSLWGFQKQRALLPINLLGDGGDFLEAFEAQVPSLPHTLQN